MKQIILFTLLVWAYPSSLTASQQPSHCSTSEKVYFNCPTSKQKIISLCGSPDLKVKGSYLQYRFGKHKKVELTYPASTEGSLKKFYFSETGAGSVAETVSFASGDYLYEIVVALGFDRKTGKRTSGFSGVMVSKDGESVSTVECSVFAGWGMDAEVIKVLPRRGV